MRSVNNPKHYGGLDNPYEVIKVIEAWGLDRCGYLFNVVKYIGRAGKKDSSKLIEDLERARWYLDRKINRLKGQENETQRTKGRGARSSGSKGLVGKRRSRSR